ncbi:unnamed protein product [Camellia sinensis]
MEEEVVLGFLKKNDEISNSGVFASEREIDHEELTNIIKSLHGFRFVDAQLNEKFDIVASIVFARLPCLKDKEQICTYTESFYMIKRSCLRMETDGKLKLQRILDQRASTVDYSDDWNPLSTLMIGTL